jgi:vesicle-associated membrane protein 4
MSIAQVDRLQDMEEKASRLEDSSSSFQKNASRVRRKMCVRSYKMLALIIILVIILLVIIIVPIVCKSSC